MWDKDRGDGVPHLRDLVCKPTTKAVQRAIYTATQPHEGGCGALTVHLQS